MLQRVYTIFLNAVRPQSDYAQALRSYIRGQLGIETFEIDRRESGRIPITDRRFPRQLGHHPHLAATAVLADLIPTAGMAGD